MRKPQTVSALDKLGRVRLSKHFFMRDMLHSEIAQMHGLANIPDDPDLAIETSTHLCEDLLEPLQERWGRITIRSAYRSREVNQLGNDMQRAGKAGYNCASNAANAAGHIWDMLDGDGHKGGDGLHRHPRILGRAQPRGRLANSGALDRRQSGIRPAIFLPGNVGGEYQLARKAAAAGG